MKIPDKETITILFCWLQLGLLASFCLWKFAEIPFLHSVGFTTPASLIVGYLSIWLLDKWTDAKIKRFTTVLQTLSVDGLGVISQIDEHWEIILPPDPKIGITHEIHVTIDSPVPDDHPTEKQLDIVRSFCRCYSAARDHIQENLRNYFEEQDASDELHLLKLDHISVHINPPEDDEQMEISYETTPMGGDMCYAVVLKDWRVIDVYGYD